MRGRAWSYAAGVCSVLGVLASCIVDRDKPCDSHQVELEGRLTGCVCAPDAVPNAAADGCVPCAEHEQVRGGVCVCESGYAKPQPDSACAPIVDAGQSDGGGASGAGPSGEGMPCDGPADCADYAASYCQTIIAPHVCLVQGCASGVSRCSGSNVCCSFDDFALLASTHGLCIPEANCVAPGKVVNP